MDEYVPLILCIQDVCRALLALQSGGDIFEQLQHRPAVDVMKAQMKKHQGWQPSWAGGGSTAARSCLERSVAAVPLFYRCMCNAQHQAAGGGGHASFSGLQQHWADGC